MAQPSLLTKAEWYKIIDRPPPDVVRARIELTSHGELSTVAALVVKATPDASRLNDSELFLMANDFHEATLNERFMQGNWIDGPGAREASTLWHACEELGRAEELKTIGAARLKQYLKGRAIKDALWLAEIARKEALANTPEALRKKEKERVLKREEQDTLKEGNAIIEEINTLYLKLDRDINLEDEEIDKLEQEIKKKRAQRHAIFLKGQAICERLYALGPLNPHKELAKVLDLKQKAIMDRLVALGIQLQGLQDEKNRSEAGEVKDKIQDGYAKWAVVTQDHSIAVQRLNMAASDVCLFREDEVQKERKELERKVLRNIQREMGEEETDPDELRLRIRNAIIQHQAFKKESRARRVLQRRGEKARDAREENLDV